MNARIYTLQTNVKFDISYTHTYVQTIHIAISLGRKLEGWANVLYTQYASMYCMHVHMYVHKHTLMYVCMYGLIAHKYVMHST